MMTKAAWLLVVVGSEQRILVESFGIYWPAMSPCLNYRLDAFARRGMDEIDCRVGRPREPDNAFERKFLRQLGMD